jgi:hypothetical protein
MKHYAGVERRTGFPLDIEQRRLIHRLAADHRPRQQEHQRRLHAAWERRTDLSSEARVTE